jgi:hypothetical protein
VNFTPQRIGYHDDADAHDEDGENYRIVSFFDASSVVAAPGRRGRFIKRLAFC